MTVYVFDSGPLIDLFRHYYPKRFPSLWTEFRDLVEKELITSTREVFNELKGAEDELSAWCKVNRSLFETPNAKELAVVSRIFADPHFQANIRQKERLSGKPVADPFVVARASCLTDACVVTNERHSPNAAKIPNLCEELGVEWTNLSGFMEREGWEF